MPDRAPRMFKNSLCQVCERRRIYMELNGVLICQECYEKCYEEKEMSKIRMNKIKKQKGCRSNATVANNKKKNTGKKKKVVKYYKKGNRE